MSSIRVKQLETEHLVDPLGLDRPHPRLGWIVAAANSACRAVKQSAYQIIAGPTAEELGRRIGTLWDSGKVASDETLDIPYGGAALRAHQRVHWAVRVWDQRDQPSTWSAPAHFSVGLLPPAAWSAQWIGLNAPAISSEQNTPSLAGASWITVPYGISEPPSASATVFETDYAIEDQDTVLRGTLCAAADDAFSVSINGTSMG